MTRVSDRFTGPTPGILHDLNRAKAEYHDAAMKVLGPQHVGIDCTTGRPLPDQCAESITDHRNILRTAFVKGNEQ